jgi:hypothetical protein
MPRSRWIGRVALGGLVACGGATSGGSTGATTTSGTSDASGSDPAPTGTTGAPAPTACAGATDLTASPRTIAEALAFIEGLPRPLTLECFLERLARPLAIAATSSPFSLQPAVGARSPRLFLIADGFIMSVAVSGDGVDLLEFGEFVDATRSIKAEVEFPVEGPLDPAAPFTRILSADLPGTKCAVCHRDEASAPGYPQAFASNALRFPEIDEVPLADLRAAYDTCDPADDPARCARLAAVFAHGPVTQGRFPDGLPTIHGER